MLLKDEKALKLRTLLIKVLITIFLAENLVESKKCLLYQFRLILEIESFFTSPYNVQHLKIIGG